jgi:hypothetical protein
VPSLNELIGYTVTVHSENVNRDHPVRVKLHGVEAGGVWIESKELTDHWSHEIGKSGGPQTLIWFLPFSQIAWIMAAIGVPALSEKGLGVGTP